MIEFVKFKAFVALAKTGSFSKAAELLKTSQPVVSIYIKQLEEHYGVKLVDRLGRRNVLTKEGEIFYKYASQIIKLEEELRSMLSSTRGELRGSLVIGGSNIPGMYIIPRLASGFLKEHKDVRLNTVIGDSKEIIQSVVNGELELGFVGMVQEEKKLDYQVVAKDRLVLIAPPDFEKDRISPEELLKLPYVQREHGSGTRKTIERFLRKNLKTVSLNVVAVLSSNEAVKEAVKAGLGVSFVSSISVEEDAKTGKLKVVDVDDFNIEREFYMIKRKGRTLSPLALSFYNYVTEKTEL